jgi:tRNA threonylcarbamoyladenosine biosynthesis protein TsaE
MGNRASMQPLSSPASWTRFATPEALERLGARIAATLQAGEAVCLFGALGAGKSTLARGLVRALLDDPEAEVPSPTFTLAQGYENDRLAVVHFDLYRLKRPEEAFELGLDEALDVGAVVIEWPERLEGDLPPDRLELRLTADAPPGETGGNGRWVQASGAGSWTAARVEQVMSGVSGE